MKIYTLIGTMKVDKGTGTLENGRMMYVPTVTTSEKEMRELTDWYDYTCTKWSEITISEEAKEAVKTRVIYTWRDEEGKIRYSQDPKYAFKKIMEAKYGNLGYDD
jgi:hypothetical protein